MNLAVQLYSSSHSALSKSQSISESFFSTGKCMKINKNFLEKSQWLHMQWCDTVCNKYTILSFFCRSTLNQIEGSMEYNFQEAGVIKPVSYLQMLSSLTGLSKRKIKHYLRFCFKCVAPATTNKITASPLH